MCIYLFPSYFSALCCEINLYTGWPCNSSWDHSMKRSKWLLVLTQFFLLTNFGGPGISLVGPLISHWQKGLRYASHCYVLYRWVCCSLWSTCPPWPAGHHLPSSVAPTRPEDGDCRRWRSAALCRVRRVVAGGRCCRSPPVSVACCCPPMLRSSARTVSCTDQWQLASLYDVALTSSSSCKSTTAPLNRSQWRHWGMGTDRPGWHPPRGWHPMKSIKVTVMTKKRRQFFSGENIKGWHRQLPSGVTPTLVTPLTEAQER